MDALFLGVTKIDTAKKQGTDLGDYAVSGEIFLLKDTLQWIGDFKDKTPSITFDTSLPRQ